MLLDHGNHFALDLQIRSFLWPAHIDIDRAEDRLGKLRNIAQCIPDTRLKHGKRALDRLWLWPPDVLIDLRHQHFFACFPILRHRVGSDNLGLSPHVCRLIGHRRAGHPPHDLEARGKLAHLFGALAVVPVDRELVQAQRVDVGARLEFFADDLQPIMIDHINVSILSELLQPLFLGPVQDFHRPTRHRGADLAGPREVQGGKRRYNQQLLGQPGLVHKIPCPQRTLRFAGTHVIEHISPRAFSEHRTGVDLHAERRAPAPIVMRGDRRWHLPTEVAQQQRIL